MGLIVDTNVFIKFEKADADLDFSQWESSDAVHFSAVTVSELLVGVHRANTEQRRAARRSGRKVESCGMTTAWMIFLTILRPHHEGICKTFGFLTPSEIFDLRENVLGLTQEEFARLTGIGLATISRWERGGAEPRDGSISAPVAR